MDRIRFIKSNILSLGEENYVLLKDAVINNYIPFSFLENEDITKEILAEKICDYFDVLEAKTIKSFDKCIEDYMIKLNDIVGNKIKKPEQQKKKDSIPMPVSRAWKYYEKAMLIKDCKQTSEQQLLDYSRIMFCLYSEIIKNNGEIISNFNYSAESLRLFVILSSMKNEKKQFFGESNRFNLNDLYCLDSCTFLITCIMICNILDEKLIGED